MQIRGKRFSVVVGDPDNGFDWRFTIRLWPTLATAAALFALPILIGLGARWSARTMIAELKASNASLRVENASYRLGYRFVSFAVLMSVAYRSFFLKQTSWDLFAIIILGGVVTTVYQRNQRILTMRWARLTVLSVALAMAVAAVLWLAVR